MKFDFVPMTINYAREMEKWKYEGTVKHIFVEPYFQSFNETGIMKGPGGCYGFAVLYQDSLIGLFEYYINNEMMEIGLALNPKIVGKGMGKDYVYEGIIFGIRNFNYKKEFIKLNVDAENVPAIRVYEKVGFKVYKEEKGEIEMRIYI